MRRRPPPSAARIAISRFRVVARASNRLPMLTQPIINTNPTVPSSKNNCGRMPPINTSSRRETATPREAISCGWRSAMPAVMRSRSACAPSTVLPDLSFARTRYA